MPLLSPRRLGAVALALGLSLPASDALLHPARAQAAITGVQTTTATVETVDHDTGTVLLRDAHDNLITVTVPKGKVDLPHLEAGDLLGLRFFQTMDAAIARPDTPLPISTLQTSKGYVHRHPHGTLISFLRQRVTIVAIDLQTSTVTFTTADKSTRTVTLHAKTMQAILPSLKSGDDVDVTTMDAISFVVMNRTNTSSVSVTEQSGAATTPK